MTHPDLEEKKVEITSYFHCKTCLDMENMTDNSRIVVGQTKDGRIQIWCENCDKEVITYPNISHSIQGAREEGYNQGCLDTVEQNSEAQKFIKKSMKIDIDEITRVAREEERDEILRVFIERFCDDTGDEIRWASGLRSDELLHGLIRYLNHPNEATPVTASETEKEEGNI